MEEEIELVRPNGNYLLTTTIDASSGGDTWTIRVIGRDKHKIKLETFPGGRTEAETATIVRGMVAKYLADGWYDDRAKIPAEAKAAINARVARSNAREAKREAENKVAKAKKAAAKAKAKAPRAALHTEQATAEKKLLAKGAKHDIDAETIRRALRPCIDLTTRKATKVDLAVGKTRFGGAPDLAKGAKWPRGADGPMPFVAQIDLAQIKPYAAGALPDRGVLAFFASDFETGAVVYTEKGAVATPAPAGVMYCGCPKKPFPPCGVELRGGISLPGELDDGDEDAWPEIVEASRGKTLHRMLGHDFGDTEGEIKDAEIVLLAVGSDDRAGMEWGDVGNIYFVIDAKSLAKRAWNRVRIATTA